MALPVFAGNPPPTQVFYVPFPEDQQLQGFKAINAAAVEPIAVFVTLAAASDGTVIYYDHWEDGYEKDITNPKQATTLIFGDGNPANGYPPGNAADLISAGTVFNLRNFVNTTTLQSVVDFDARDKIASFKPISVTKMTFPGGTNTLLAGCVEVFERGLWGTEYRSPVGVDMPTSTATSKLTFDEDLFNYTALTISAGAGGSTVQIDKDNNGAFEETIVLAEGQSIYRDNVNAGGRVVGSRPVQVVLFTGTLNSSYASRDSSLLPAYRWSSDYYCPVSTRTNPADGTVVFLSNPNATAITVNYAYRNSATATTTASVNVPAGGNARVALSPANGSTHFGAYRFYTTGANPPVFSAIGTIDSDSAAGSNVGWDGGFTLVAKPSLTTQVLVSLGIGRDPYSTTNPTENGNPVWVTTSGNGNTKANVYVDYNGDNAGPLIDPNGNKYDVLLTPRELEQLKLYDPDGDQSGMLVYTLDPSVRIAAVWGQDPSVAAFAQPGLDVASLVPPMREGDAGKISSLAVDADGDGFISAGDTLAYDIRTVSNARTNIPGPFKIQDTAPANTAYVSGSSRYRFTVGGAWQAWSAIPDDISGTAIPLDGSGFSVPGNLGSGQQLQVEFRTVIANYGSLSSSTITNNGIVEISPYGLIIPVEWSDELSGSIGDRVWNDLNGNGVQEAGENGIAGIQVFIDTNGNGIFDSGEPTSTSGLDGKYLLAGLSAGTYQVRVNPATVAAVNVGYGPTWDLDGNVSPHAATVVLAAAQDRVDADFGYRVGASVGDRVWADRNGNRVQGAGEFGINGVRVYVDTNGNGSFNAGEPSAITYGNGDYYIGNLNPGTWSVRVDSSTLPAGATQTHDLTGALDNAGSVTLIAAEHRGDLDFGYRGNLSIGDLVWEDSDASGTVTRLNVYDGRIDMNNTGGVGNGDDGFIGSVRIIDGYVDLNNSNSITSADAGVFQGYTVIAGGLDITGNGSIGTNDDATAAISSEAGISNVRVYIDINGNGVFDATEPSSVTDANGIYNIGNLFNGTYTVRVATGTLPVSFVPTYDLTSPTGDHSATVVLSGSSRTDVDFGYRNDASIGDLVWNDRDGDGIRDAGEPGISDVLVYLDENGNDSFDQGSERFVITDVNGIYHFDNLPAGTFTVGIDFSTLPQGAAATYDRDGIGSLHLATRTLAVSEDATDVDFGYRASASVGDLVWNDLNANGVKDGAETGIQNARVYLDINGNGVFDSATEPSSVTNSTGAWSIDFLVPGTYTARIDASTLAANLVLTYDATDPLDGAATFSLAATEARTDIDFGYTSLVTLGNFVWNDVNANGRQDSGEPGIPDVTVTVFNAVNSTIAGTTVTNASGIYSFPMLLPGTYYVAFDKPVGYDATLADRGNDTGDSDANITTGLTGNYVLVAGASNITVDAGFYQPVSLGDIVFNDANANGIQDLGESGLAGVLVSVYRPGFGPDGIAGNSDDATAVATYTTLAGGAYSFTGLRPGTYQVGFGALSGYNRTLADQGADDTKDSDANATTGLSGNHVLSAGATNNTIDAGYYQPGTVFGHLYIDTNGSGTQDSGEPDLADVDVIVTDSLNNLHAITTDSSGNWTVSVPPGSTSVNVDETDPQYPTGYAQTEGTDPTVVTAVSGTSTNGGIDGYYLSGSLSGTVYVDTDNDGDADTTLGGVVIRLLDGFGNPVLDGLGAPVTTTTAPDGTYSFGNLPPGDYCVAQDQPTGYASVSDTDGPNDNVIGNVTPITVTAGANTGGNDFIEIELGVISGYVLLDTDNNGSGDSFLTGVILNLLDGSGNPVLDGLGAPIQVASGANGYYSFTLVATGTYQVSQNQPAGYGSVSDVDGANNNLIGDETAIVMTPGLVVTNRDFVEIEFGSISGSVTKDTDANGSGETPFQGVVLALLDGSGDPVMSGGQPVTATTDVNGDYSFTSLFPGNYQVSETQPSGYGSVSDVDGGNLDLIGNVVPLSVDPGGDVIGRDFVEIELGAISGYVTANGSPLANVTLTLLDGSGAVIDGDPNTNGIQPITVTTDSNGFYIFNGVMPGSYQVAQTQPEYYNSEGDKDGGDLNIGGDVTLIVVLPGQTNATNNFTETLSTCPSTWAHWKLLHPTGTAGGNPDADDYDNFAEFAFAMPYDSGVGSQWLGSTAWIIQPSASVPGTLEGVFVRPIDAVQNVTYTLQYAASLGNPIVWQSIAITPEMIAVTANADCTETVTIFGLETATGLVDGSGFVRLKVELDEAPPSGTDHTSFTEVEGWKDTGLELCCRTYSNPFLRETAYTGTVTGVIGQTLDLTGSAGGSDLGDIITGGSFYLEVTSGENEGQRFDVNSGTVDSLTLATDTDLTGSAAPYSTRLGALSANLVGDRIALRRHWTLGEIFPADGFGATGDPTTADQIQLFSGGAWSFFWLYDDGVNPPRWVKSGDNTYTDRASLVVPPGQGLFFNNRTAATSILAYGEVRSNAFVRPTAAGSNLVSGGYPIDQSAAATGGRAMNVGQGFFGSRDLATADTFYIWRGDSIIGADGYNSWFLNDNSPRVPQVVKWVKIGDASLLSRDAELLLLGNRSMFLRSRDGSPTWTAPAPWTP